MFHRKNKWGVFLIAMLFITACQVDVYTPSPKQKLVNKIRNDVALQLQWKVKGLYPCGTGGRMRDQITMLALSFDYFGPMDREKGRKILLLAVEEFTKAINEDENIRPYLNNYPFELKNIEIFIFLRKADRSFYSDGELCIISSRNGLLEYEIRDPKADHLLTVHKETYKEAVQKVKEENFLENTL